MTLRQWLRAAGPGALNRLHFATGLSLPTIGRAKRGRATLASAIKLHDATGVPIASMTFEPVPAMLAARQRKVAAR